MSVLLVIIVFRSSWTLSLGLVDLFAKETVGPSPNTQGWESRGVGLLVTMRIFIVLFRLQDLT